MDYSKPWNEVRFWDRLLWCLRGHDAAEYEQIRLLQEQQKKDAKEAESLRLAVFRKRIAVFSEQTPAWALDAAQKISAAIWLHLDTGSIAMPSIQVMAKCMSDSLQDKITDLADTIRAETAK